MNTTTAEPHPGKRSWIFQAVPRYFDLTEALKHIRIFRWRIEQFKNDIRAGDDVFLWLAGSEGGMVARGRVITDPQIMEDAPEELPFVKEEDQDEDRFFAAIEIDTVGVSHPRRCAQHASPFDVANRTRTPRWYLR